MSDAEVWLSIALGVFIAVIYPVLYRYIRKEFPPTAGLIPSWLKDQVKKYAALAVFSMLTAFIVLSLYRTNGSAWRRSPSICSLQISQVP